MKNRTRKHKIYSLMIIAALLLVLNVNVYLNTNNKIVLSESDAPKLGGRTYIGDEEVPTYNFMYRQDSWLFLLICFNFLFLIFALFLLRQEYVQSKPKIIKEDFEEVKEGKSNERRKRNS